MFRHISLKLIGNKYKRSSPIADRNSFLEVILLNTTEAEGRPLKILELIL